MIVFCRLQVLTIVLYSSQGIGFEICKKLGAAGVKVIAACRNESLGVQAVAKLQAHGYDVEYRNLDLSNDASIARFSDGLSEHYRSIDILVNNAGIAYKINETRSYDEQAYAILTTNFFGTMRFTEAILPLLRKAKAPRIVNVSSQGGLLKILKSETLKERFTSCSTIQDLESLVNEYLTAVYDRTYGEKGWPHANYGVSKLALNTLTRILAKREAAANPNKNFLINACSPGFCDTDLNHHKGKRTAEHGARTPAMLALLSEIGPVALTGKFYYDDTEIDW